MTDRRVVLFARTRGRRERWVARLRDFCPQGVGVLTDAPLDAGDLLVLRLLCPGGGHLPLVLRVRHCTRDARGRYQVGAELARVGLGDGPVSRPAPPPSLPPPTSLAGKTVCDFDRVLDVRVEPTRVWLNMHPPGATSGWGVYVDRAALDAALGHRPTSEK